MKIFFITSKLKNEDTASGSVIELEYMMKELMRLGNRVSAVTVFSQFNDLITPPPYTLFEERCTSQRLLPIQWSIYTFLKKYEAEADIFHIDAQFMYGAGLYRLLRGKRPVFAYLIRPPLVMENYVSYFFKDRFHLPDERGSVWRRLKYYLRLFVERFLLTPILASRVDYVSCLNPLLLKEHYEFGLRPAAYGLIIGDTYPMDETMKKAGIDEYSYRNRAGKNEKVILYCFGRMAPGKGYDLFLEAFAQVKNKEHFQVILGGSGPEEPLIRRAITELGLERHVVLPGWVSRQELYQYLRQADVYVFARWGSILSALSLVETMVFGIPSLVPAGTGLAWEAGKSALTFIPEDPADLARQIERLGADVELRKALSSECYRRLREADIDPHQTVVAMNVIMKSLAFSPRINHPLRGFLKGYRQAGKEQV